MRNVLLFPCIAVLLFALSSCSVKYTEMLAEKGFDKECINKYKAAMKYYNKAILLNRQSAYAYWRRAGLHSRGYDEYEKAIKDLNRAIEIDSSLNGGYAYWDRADCKAAIKDYSGALHDYNEAIKIDPVKENFYFKRANLKYYWLNDKQGSLNDLDSAIKFWDGYDLARHLRAKIFVEKSDFKAAMHDYESLQYGLILDSNAEYADVLYYRGIAKFETGDEKGACVDWSNSLRNGSLLAKEKTMLCK